MIFPKTHNIAKKRKKGKTNRKNHTISKMKHLFPKKMERNTFSFRVFGLSFILFTVFDSILEENGSTTARRRRKARTPKRRRRRRKTQHKKGQQRRTAPPSRTGEAGKTTPPKRRTTFLSFTSQLFTLFFDFTQTLLYSIPKGTTAAQSQGSGGRQHQKGGEESSTTHQKNDKTSNTQKEEGERGTPPRRNEDTATPPKKGKPHYTKQEKKCNTNQSNAAEKARGKKSRTPKYEEDDIQL